MVFRKKHFDFLVLHCKFPAVETKSYDPQKTDTWIYVERTLAILFHKQTLRLFGVTLPASRRGNKGVEPKTDEIFYVANRGVAILGLRCRDVPLFHEIWLLKSRIHAVMYLSVACYTLGRAFGLFGRAKKSFEHVRREFSSQVLVLHSSKLPLCLWRFPCSRRFKE